MLKRSNRTKATACLVVWCLLLWPSAVRAQVVTIPSLTLDGSPADSDALMVHKSGETRAKRTTRGTLRSGLAARAGVISGGTDASPAFGATAVEALGGLAVASGALKWDYTATLAGNPALAASQVLAGTTGLLFEGATADAIEGLLTAADPTSSDRTWTLPNVTGTIVTTGDTDSVSATMIATGAVATAEILDDTILAGDIATGAVTTTEILDDTITGADIASSVSGRSLTEGSNIIDADLELYRDTKCAVIESPASGDDFLLFRAESAITVTGIDCLAIAGTSVATLVKECDGNGGSCGNTEASITCGTTNTTESGGIDDAAIDAGDWVRVDPGTVTGSVTQLAVCVTFTWND